jgi:hypothetical protein
MAVALSVELAPGDCVKLVVDEWREVMPCVDAGITALANGRELPADLVPCRVVHRERAPVEVPSALRVGFSRRVPRL